MFFTGENGQKLHNPPHFHNLHVDYTYADYTCADYEDREGNPQHQIVGHILYLICGYKQICNLFTACSPDHHGKFYHNKYTIHPRFHKYFKYKDSIIYIMRKMFINVHKSCHAVIFFP